MTTTTQAVGAGVGAAGAAAGAAVYVPGEWALICCFLGAALSVWAQAARVELSGRALFGLLGQYATSVAVGYVGVVFAHYMLPRYELTMALAEIPDYAQAIALAGCAQAILALAAAFARRKVDAV